MLSLYYGLNYGYSAALYSADHQSVNEPTLLTTTENTLFISMLTTHICQTVRNALMRLFVDIGPLSVCWSSNQSSPVQSNLAVMMSMMTIKGCCYTQLYNGGGHPGMHFIDFGQLSRMKI